MMNDTAPKYAESEIHLPAGKVLLLVIETTHSFLGSDEFWNDPIACSSEHIAQFIELKGEIGRVNKKAQRLLKKVIAKPVNKE